MSLQRWWSTIYEDVQLQSCHSVRQRERTRLTPKFIEHFLEAAEEQDLKNVISTDIAQITHQLITDGVVTNPDKEFEHLQEEQTDTFETHTSETVERKLNEEEIQHLFDRFSIDALSPLYPEERSINRIKKSISEFFKNEFTMKFQYAGVDEQMVVLANVNRQHFLDVINLAKEKYLEEVEKRAKELAIDEIWEVPLSVDYSAEHTKRDLDLSIMQPFYEKTNASTVENKFVKFLNDQKDEIEWWFKNGERDRKFFAVPRKEGKDDVPFYVDWIVK